MSAVPEPLIPSEGDAAEGPPAPGIFVRLGRNAGWILGGKAGAGVASLVYFALAARALGPTGFGIFSLILAYGQGIAALVQFQSWQTVIRYGAGHLAADRKARLGRLLGMTAAMDLLAASAGALIAFGGIGVVTPLLHWNSHEAARAPLFAAVILLFSAPTPIGALRLLDRFDLLAFCQASVPMIRLVGACTAWMIGGTVGLFLMAWGLAAVVQGVTLWIVALRQIATGGVRILWPGFRAAGLENPRLWSFLFATNLAASMSMVWQQMGTLAVGAAGGPAAAGGFRLASKLALALGKPVALFGQALFPEFARLVASSDAAMLRHLLTRMTMIAMGFAALVLAVGLFGAGPLLQIVGGRDFEFARPFLLLLAVAAAIDLSGFALDPLLVAHGRAGTVLRARAIGASCYLAALLLFLRTGGPIGGAYAAIVGTAIVRGQLAFAVRRLIRTAGK